MEPFVCDVVGIERLGGSELPARALGGVLRRLDRLAGGVRVATQLRRLPREARRRLVLPGRCLLGPGRNTTRVSAGEGEGDESSGTSSGE